MIVDQKGVLVVDQKGVLIVDQKGVLVVDQKGVLVVDQKGVLVVVQKGVLVLDQKGMSLPLAVRTALTSLTITLSTTLYKFGAIKSAINSLSIFSKTRLMSIKSFNRTSAAFTPIGVTGARRYGDDSIG